MHYNIRYTAGVHHYKSISGEAILSSSLKGMALPIEIVFMKNTESYQKRMMAPSH